MSGRPAGIWPILYAFFDERGELDRELMRRQVDACVAAHPAGIACLGLATEVQKLESAERYRLVEWVAEWVGGRVPFAVTVAEPTVASQRRLIAAAAEHGAAWVILQPPPAAAPSEAELAAFFADVAADSPIPVAIQNAAQYIGTGLGVDTLIALNRRQPQISILKAEAPAVDVAHLVERSAGVFSVFNGRGGLEQVDGLRAGMDGLIPAPDCVDVQCRIHAAYLAGDEAEAERLYRRILPAIVFVMQSIPSLVCYGKRLTARRMGIEPEAVHDRAPALRPSPFGLATVERLAAGLGPLDG